MNGAKKLIYMIFYSGHAQVAPASLHFHYFIGIKDFDQKKKKNKRLNTIITFGIILRFFERLILSIKNFMVNFISYELCN